MYCINWHLDQEAWSAVFDLLVKAASSMALSSVRRHKMWGCLSLSLDDVTSCLCFVSRFIRTQRGDILMPSFLFICWLECFCKDSLCRINCLVSTCVHVCSIAQSCMTLWPREP